MLILIMYAAFVLIRNLEWELIGTTSGSIVHDNIAVSSNNYGNNPLSALYIDVTN